MSALSDSLADALSDPVIRLTLALADYSVRRLAPVVLERIANVIQSSSHEVRVGSAATDWQSVAAIVASFRRVANELAEMAPLTSDTADRLYRLLDNVRTGIDWIEWPGGSRRDDLHDLVIDTVMPAGYARAACRSALEDPQAWQLQYGNSLAAAQRVLLGLTIQSVRRTCSAVEAMGVRADDLTAFSEPLGASMIR